MPAHSYRYPVDKLFTGSSLGNVDTFLRLTPQTDIAGLWSARDNQYYCGRFVAHAYLHGERATPLETTFSAARQETTFLCGPLRIVKQVFLAMRDEPLQVVRMIVSAENPTDEPVDVAIMCDIHYPAFVWPGSYKVPDQPQRNKRVESRELDGLIVSSTAGRSQEVRVFGASVEAISTYVTDRGFSRTYRMPVPARSSASASLSMAISDQGEADALVAYRGARPAAEALADAEAFYESVRQTGYLRTPDPLINRAIDWAKINTVRVQHHFRAGYGFTNDPSQDIVVIRDAAWYVLGSDYLTPEFSKKMLDLVARYGIEDGGKITEFIVACADPPLKSDYDLNINDDTPLIVAAVYHHYAVTADRASLLRYWPMVRGACDWILSQIQGGLVHAHSQEANVWGISGWRNVIPQSQISGAVTEINVECSYALRLAAELADFLGHQDLGREYAAAAEQLKQTINRRLVSSKTGLYLLNIDPEGEEHHDLTGDQIFAVLFGVADGDRKRKILDKLHTPEFWTPFGVRTVGKLQEESDPDHGVQLLGGVWPNLTAWVAYCSKSYSPRRLVSGMRNIWKISEIANPKAYQNVVPGHFPERLSGQTFKSRGMAMSPWMPPTYLWLGYEGLLGLEPTLSGLRVNPHLPEDWKWLGVKGVPVLGSTLTCFYYRRTLYSTMDVSSRSRCVTFDEDVSRFVECDAPFCVALRDAGKTIVFIGADDGGSFRLAIDAPITPNRLELTIDLRPGDCRLLTFPAGKAAQPHENGSRHEEAALRRA
ncbi:MAG: hypothetical protein GIX02_12890 [Candidatus Eremiobacteraeota bacterium]|nr:hypothetical protein [Candidatus Eremiobacteraeota bacterium]